jgi:hypothetical protein
MNFSKMVPIQEALAQEFSQEQDLPVSNLL